jgi:hypothetical protein
VHGYVYAKHPVIKEVNQKRFKLGELSRLTKIMEKEKVLSMAEYKELRGRTNVTQKQLIVQKKYLTHYNK